VAYQAAMTSILEDVQNKLIFRAQAYITRHVDRFSPKPEDLNYPDKLLTTSRAFEKPEGGLARSLILLSDQESQGY